ncbi:hypothetical protein BW723_00110 [Polaribacter reichenbachii]|uniref:Uncharacterized protein n=1 Tax=Polaribacter reichenbachii TaxID=996801 RepID=A0A1B8U513_9FLAO|nr:hypothetical protein BW723_00110 [Polaribacter reichenbachii]AUC18652.1 hypothetical protein BTO17_08115 [Polaribacter reichenbachii]OBY66947.1 hypothetical protein LPB301_05005 [Polaribacter reichenbachii]
MENYSISEIKTVLKPPIIINFIDEINCPICDIEIYLKDKLIDNDSFVYCKDCNHKIVFRIIKI